MTISSAGGYGIYQCGIASKVLALPDLFITPLLNLAIIQSSTLYT